MQRSQLPWTRWPTCSTTSSHDPVAERRVIRQHPAGPGVSLERCPGCRARLQTEPACPRCGCDLTLVRRAEAQSQRWLALAVQAWARGNHVAARQCASAALALEPLPLARALLQWPCPLEAARDEAGSN